MPMSPLGNVIGSNMFNLLGIIGISSLVGPIPVEPGLLRFDIWVMLAASLVLAPFVSCGGRWAGSLASCSRRSTSATSRCCWHRGRRMTALVTGAAKRLGRAMALRLAERGHDVAVHYAGSAEAAQATVAEIRAMGRTAHAVQADLTVEAEMQALLPAAAEALGRPITVLVNNASIFEYDNIRDRHPRELGQAPGIEPSRALRAEPGLGGAGPGGPARRDRRAAGARPDRQHDRPARAQADAGIHELHDRQDGALGADPHLGTGAGAACTGECDRTGSDDAGARQSEEHFARQRRPRSCSAGPTPKAYARHWITCCRRGP
jgi:hypothetical protein